MKISPVHSSNPTDPDVYHDQSTCHYYLRIPTTNEVKGTGGYRKCSRCVELAAG